MRIFSHRVFLCVFLYKYHLNQYHIADGAAEDGKHGIAFPQMEGNGNGGSNQRRYPASQRGKGDPFDTVDDQGCHDGHGQDSA